jgi:hypothetical protein
LLDVFNNGSVMSEDEFVSLFGTVPALPDDAFVAYKFAPTRDRNGPMSPDAWDSDPTGYLRD